MKLKMSIMLVLMATSTSFSAVNNAGCFLLMEGLFKSIDRHHTVRSSTVDPSLLSLKSAESFKIDTSVTSKVVPSGIYKNAFMLESMKTKIKTSTTITKNLNEIKKKFPKIDISQFNGLRMETIKINSAHPEFDTATFLKEKPKLKYTIQKFTELNVLYSDDKIIAVKNLKNQWDSPGQPERMIPDTYFEFTLNPDCSLENHSEFPTANDKSFCENYFNTMGTSEQLVSYIPRAETGDKFSPGECHVPVPSTTDNSNTYRIHPLKPYISTEKWQKVKLKVTSLKVLMNSQIKSGSISKVQVQDLRRNQDGASSLKNCESVIKDKNQYEDASMVMWYEGMCGLYAPFYRAPKSVEDTSPAKTNTIDGKIR